MGHQCKHCGLGALPVCRACALSNVCPDHNPPSVLSYYLGAAAKATRKDYQILPGGYKEAREDYDAMVKRTGVDRAVANSPPPLSDVGDDVSFMMDEGMGMLTGDETYPEDVNPHVVAANRAGMDQRFPQENEAVADIFQGAEKFDHGKPDMLRWVVAYFPDALEEVARVSTAGAAKYAEGGWRFVADGIRRYAAAMGRHMVCIARGETFDTDPHPAFVNVRHQAQVAWNALAVLQLQLKP